jgi:hypothetical protein
MSRVIGIPLTKGNSDVIVAVKIEDADLATMVEGQACWLQDGSPVSAELVVSKAKGTGSFYGFIFDINLCTGYASCIRSAESVYLPSTDGELLVAGGQVAVNETTGLIEAGGATLTNGVVLLAGVTQLVNRKGVRYDGTGACIRILGGREVNAVVAVANANKSTTVGAKA